VAVLEGSPVEVPVDIPDAVLRELQVQAPVVVQRE